MATSIMINRLLIREAYNVRKSSCWTRLLTITIYALYVIAFTVDCQDTIIETEGNSEPVIPDLTTVDSVTHDTDLRSAETQKSVPTKDEETLAGKGDQNSEDDSSFSVLTDSFRKAVKKVWEYSQDFIATIAVELNDYELHNNTDNSTIAPNNASLTLEEEVVEETNSTDEASQEKPQPARQIVCVARNMTENVTSAVLVVNSTELHARLSNRDNITGYCAVVMFYAPWCSFCARTAPHFNALGRAFPQLDVLAIDAVHFSSWNVRYGTIAVPNIIVFYNGRQVSRFNGTKRTYDSMAQFVFNVTGFSPSENITLTDVDHEGPVPSEAKQGNDYLLVLAWLLVITCLVTASAKSARFQQMYTRVQTLWQEHQHLD